MKFISILILSFSTVLLSFSQEKIDELSWKKVATGMPSSWYGSEESYRVASNILLYQRSSGGWPKNIEKHRSLTETEKNAILNQKNDADAIFDNSATTTEMRFLALMFNASGKKEYKESFNRGLKFILDAQYENGGWPMFWPLRKGYYTHITFNDNAIVNILTLLRDIKNNKNYLKKITDKKLLKRCDVAFGKGIECILKTQIRVNGKPAVWCAQHDEVTLAPAAARSYELPSFSGGESAGIVMLLMDIENPGKEIREAIEGAIEWLEANKLNNVKLEYFVNKDGLKDRRIADDPNGGVLWARFYDLETSLPFFCDRDGVKKWSLDEIGYERRTGYSWYTDSPSDALKKYSAWKKRITGTEIPEKRN